MPATLRGAKRNRQTFRAVRNSQQGQLIVPKVVEAISRGHQPTILLAERLKSHADLPIDWNAQQQVLSGC